MENMGSLWRQWSRVRKHWRWKWWKMHCCAKRWSILFTQIKLG
jgi:hypothetical protein